MYKKKKVADGGGSSRGGTDAMDEEMDFKKIMKDIELFSRSFTLLISSLHCFRPNVLNPNFPHQLYIKLFSLA